MSVEILLTFDTTHHAMAARDLLRAHGSVTVLPTPVAITAGCGMALLTGGDLYEAQKDRLEAFSPTPYRITENGYAPWNEKG